MCWRLIWSADRRGRALSVVYEKPPESRLLYSAHVESADFATLFFTVKDEQVSDYHYYLYDEFAALLVAPVAGEGAGYSMHGCCAKS